MPEIADYPRTPVPVAPRVERERAISGNGPDYPLRAVEVEQVAHRATRGAPLAVDAE
jgi:hypothetical protein